MPVTPFEPRPAAGPTRVDARVSTGVSAWRSARISTRWAVAALAAAAALAAPPAPAVPVPAEAPAAARPTACPPLLRQRLLRLQDEVPVDLCRYAGRVLLVVNTASFCGYTPQYQALEALQRRYEGRGLVVLGFPSNDFGQQEPGSNAEIAEFCSNTFGVKFPMFTKSSVAPAAGRTVNPLYVQLQQRTGQAPRWNFHKYLIGRDGDTVRTYGSAVSPQDPALLRDLERLLKAN